MPSEPNPNPDLDTSPPLPPWRSWLFAVVVAVMPLSFNIGPWVDAKQKSFFVSPFDALVPLLVLLLLWDLVRRRAALRDIPFPNLLWMLLALASFIWIAPGTQGKWLRTAVGQIAPVVFCGVWVFSQAAQSVRELRRLFLILGASLGVCLLFALYQYVQPLGHPYDPENPNAPADGVWVTRIAGWYEIRGILAAQIAMLVPAAGAFAVLDKDSAVRAGAACFAVLGLCVTLSGGGFIAAAAGLLAVAGALWIRGWFGPGEQAERRTGQRGAAYLVAGLLVIAALVLPRLPRHNVEHLWRSVALFGEQINSGAPDAKATEERPTARLRRYQAELNYLDAKNHWVAGAGVGGFDVIDTYFDNQNSLYPKPSVRTDQEALFDYETNEPFTHGLFETTAVELGVLGLALAAWVFAAWSGASFFAFARATSSEMQLLALASLGAGVGALVFSIFGSPLVRGCGGTFAFCMGASLLLARRHASKGFAGPAE